MVTVHAVKNAGLRGHLRSRFTHAAETSLATLVAWLDQVTLYERPDVHALATAAHEPFSSRGAYQALHVATGGSDIVRIWGIRLPTKIKFFGWLLHHGRLNTRAHLFHRNLKPREDSCCEHCPGILETDTHIFVDCPCAQEIWHRLSFTLHDLTLRRPWDFDLSYPLPEAVRVDMMLLILWHIWKARNAMIFEHQHHSSSDVLRRVVQDIDSWSCRFRRLLTDINVWRDWIVNC